MKWYVIKTRNGLWIEHDESEPRNAVAGPFADYDDAVRKLELLEALDSRGGKVVGLIGAAFIAVVLVAFGAWVIGRVVS